MNIKNLQNGFSAYFQSSNIDTLTLALSKAQNEMRFVAREYKSLLEDFRIIRNAATPILAKHNLAITQNIRIDESGSRVLSTFLFHNSGQWIEACELLGFEIDERSQHFIYLRMQAYIYMTGIVIAKQNYNNMLNMENGYREISWSQFNLFLQCNRCFYRQSKKGKKRPGIDPESFKLSTKIDELVKQEMNLFRQFKAHPKFMFKYGINAIPYNDKYNSIKKWQNTRRKDFSKENDTWIFDGGIRFYDYQTNFVLYGGIDDIWINTQNEFIVVEYKTTAQEMGASIEDNDWYINFKQQISFYTWLFKKNGYLIHNKAYFFYINAGQDQLAFMPFDETLKCNVSVSTYNIDDTWVENSVTSMRNCLNQVKSPEMKKNPITNKICEYCVFARSDRD